VPFAAKDYRGSDEQLDLTVRCLIDQHRMRVDYQGLLGEGKVHDVDPYTLVHYRGGLYLICYSHRFRKTIWLAIERIRAVAKLPHRFDYPAGYSPEKHTEGMFGIIEGPETTVELLLRGKETTAFLSSRRLHPTQRFTERPDGTTLLTMTVRGTTELGTWIISQAPWVEVLRPQALRDEVAERLRAGAEMYGATAGTGRATGRPKRPPASARKSHDVG
jgi:proteasome accessory factor B